MKQSRKRIFYRVLAILLTAVCMTGCLPQIFRPSENSHSSQNSSQTASTLDSPESSSREYEQYDEQKLAEQKHFSEVEDELFKWEASRSLLDLHFLLRNPSDAGIDSARHLYAPVSLSELKQNRTDRETIKETLDSFSLSLLTDEQKLTLQILQSFLRTESKSDGLELYAQPLAPTIGIQAQLPVLLCEYPFYSREDVENYFKLLGELGDYYGQILAFEQQKAEAGLMMSDASLERVISSCEGYLLVPGNNFMIDSFNSRLDDIGDLSEDEKQTFRQKNAELLESDFVPAYQTLIDGLTALKGTGKNEKGQCGYPNGRRYYEYQVFSATGTSYSSLSDLLSAIEDSIRESLLESSEILKRRPELQESFLNPEFRQKDASAIMEEIKAQTLQDFPALPECNYTIREVPKALELSLSPAFYLTSAIDDIENNVIYINHSDRYASQPLYSLIAHEGYPGHLYQTVYFHSQNESSLRKILSFPGYTEGWATYVEQYAYTLDNGLDSDLGKLISANASASLGIQACLDLYVNAYGWEIPQIEEYLSDYYEKPEEVASALFETLVDNPANALSYYVGFLEFDQMRKTAEKKLGERFSLMEFHRFLLDMGNAPFDVIGPYFSAWLNDQKF